jgi:transposase
MGLFCRSADLAAANRKWRAMPADVPPWKTVWGMCARWKKDGVVARIVDGLRSDIRRVAGRHP